MDASQCREKISNYPKFRLNAIRRASANDMLNVKFVTYCICIFGEKRPLIYSSILNIIMDSSRCREKISNCPRVETSAAVPASNKKEFNVKFVTSYVCIFGAICLPVYSSILCNMIDSTECRRKISSYPRVGTGGPISHSNKDEFIGKCISPYACKMRINSKTVFMLCG